MLPRRRVTVVSTQTHQHSRRLLLGFPRGLRLQHLQPLLPAAPRARDDELLVVTSLLSG